MLFSEHMWKKHLSPLQLSVSRRQTSLKPMIPQTLAQMDEEHDKKICIFEFGVDCPFKSFAQRKSSRHQSGDPYLCHCLDRFQTRTQTDASALCESAKSQERMPKIFRCVTLNVRVFETERWSISEVIIWTPGWWTAGESGGNDRETEGRGGNGFF